MHALLLQDITSALLVQAHSSAVPALMLQRRFTVLSIGGHELPFGELLAAALFCRPLDEPPTSLFPMTAPEDSEQQAAEACSVLMLALRARGVACVCASLQSAADADASGTVQAYADDSNSAADTVLSTVMAALRIEVHQQCGGNTEHAPAAHVVPNAAVQQVQQFVCGVTGVDPDSTDRADLFTWQPDEHTCAAGARADAPVSAARIWMLQCQSMPSAVCGNAHHRAALLSAAHACMQLSRGADCSSKARQRAACQMFADISVAIVRMPALSEHVLALHTSRHDRDACQQALSIAGHMQRTRDLSCMLRLSTASLKASREVNVPFDTETQLLQITERMCASISLAASDCASQPATHRAVTNSSGDKFRAAAFQSLLAALPDLSTLFSVLDLQTPSSAGGSGSYSLQHVCVLLAAATVRCCAGAAADEGCRDLLVCVDMTVNSIRHSVAQGDHSDKMLDNGEALVSAGLLQLLSCQLSALSTALEAGRCDFQSVFGAVESVADFVMLAKVRSFHSSDNSDGSWHGQFQHRNLAIDGS